MAQEMVKIHMKNRKVNEIPISNLANFKRIFFAQIDYIEEQEGEPIIAKPVIEEIKTPTPPVVESVKNPDPQDAPKDDKVVANETMGKKELQDLAKGIEGYKSSMNKKQLVELINK